MKSISQQESQVFSDGPAEAPELPERNHPLPSPAREKTPTPPPQKVWLFFQESFLMV